MKRIIEKLLKLKTERSKLAKIELLKDFLEDETFRIIVEMALDETMHYNISKLPNCKPKEFTNFDDQFDSLINYLGFLSGKQGATALEKKYLAEFAFDKSWAYVIKCIITKDLKCGCGAKLINDAMPGTISIFPYCGCCTSKKKDNLVYPAFFQTKEDGLFANVIYNPRKVTYLSRNGNEFIFPEDSLTKSIMRNFPKTNETNVYTGEFRIKVNGKWLPRKTSNGLVNKALKKNQTQTTGESASIHFICWDVIPEKEFWEGYDSTPYMERFKKLQFLEEINSTRIHLSATTPINNFTEGQDLALKLLADGEEGGIIKNMKAPWKDTHSTEQIKLKAGDLGLDNEREGELKIIDWYYGKEGSKYERCLGGLICASSDDLLETRIGGGYSDEERGFLGWDGVNPIIKDNFKEWADEMYAPNKIITARFNEAIKAKTSKKWALFSARYIELRDKNTADTLEHLKEQ